MATEELEAFTGCQPWEPWFQLFEEATTSWKKRHKLSYLACLLQGEAAEYAFVVLPERERYSYRRLVRALKEQYGNHTFEQSEVCEPHESDSEPLTDTAEENVMPDCKPKSSVQFNEYVSTEEDNYDIHQGEEIDYLGYTFHHLQVLMMEKEELKQQVYHNNMEIQSLRQQIHANSGEIGDAKQIIKQQNSEIQCLQKRLHEKHDDDNQFSIDNSLTANSNIKQNVKYVIPMPDTWLPDVTEEGRIVNANPEGRSCKKSPEQAIRDIAAMGDTLPERALLPDAVNQENSQGPSQEKEDVSWSLNTNLLSICVTIMMVMYYLL
jgi:hypothetical protein